MGLLRDIVDIFSGQEVVAQATQERNVIRIKLKSHEMYKLYMLCEDMNDQLSTEQITPQMLATRVLQKFIYQSYEDTTDRVVRNLLPDFIESPPR